MVEFALIVPVFLALVLGIISFGYMLSYRQEISRATAEAARVAAFPSGTDSVEKQARDALNRALKSYGVTCEGTVLKHKTQVVGSCSIPTVAVACETGSPKQCMKVSVRHDYEDNPLVPSFPGLGVTLPNKLAYEASVEVS